MVEKKKKKQGLMAVKIKSERLCFSEGMNIETETIQRNLPFEFGKTLKQI